MTITDKMVEAAASAYLKKSGEIALTYDPPFAQQSADMEDVFTAMRAALEAAEKAAWRPIEEAQKDGSWILARLKSNTSWPGRLFQVRHEGLLVADYNIGWSLFPGYGGLTDDDFDVFRPLPKGPEE